MDGETLYGSERIVLAPAAGRFVVAPNDEVDPQQPGSIVLAGSSLGAVISSGESQSVTSIFTGVLAGLLAHDGERVREGQPVAWLRTA